MTDASNVRFPSGAFSLLIGGHKRPGVRDIDVVNPASGTPFAHCPVADVALLDEAVAAAGAAFPAWSALPIESRRSALRAAAEGIEAQRDALAALLTAEQGKPLAMARLEIQRACASLRHFADMALPVHVFRDTDEERIYERRVALGTVAAIVPWNFPVLLLMNKLAPALLSGNCVIAKPAPSTPLTTLRLGEIVARYLPPGVFSVLCDDNDLGAALTAHKDIAKVSFTGSTETGRKVFGSAAAGLKRLTLELGGNDAALMLDDADLDAAVPQIFRCAMANSGQVCMAIKRLYVPEALYEAVCGRLAALARQLVVGDGAAPGTEMGPVQNAMQYEKLKALIEETRRQGTLLPGRVPESGRGYFVAPTIARDLPDEARLVQDEQFGPILPVLPYRRLDEVVVRINQSPFGLGASVWGADLGRAVELAEQMSSGTVWVNRHMSVDPSIPFRGARQSGLGAELGEAGLHEFTQAQVVNIGR